ncbi:MAG: NAD-dependent epimerase/dehydratase family protein [Turneriella sp.]
MRFKDQKVTVTGAAGFIGRKLVEQLVSEGAKVTAVDLPGVQFPEWSGVECVNSDLSDATELRRLCSQKDIIFHLAFPVSDWEKEEKFQQAVKHSEEICRLAAVAGTRLVITTSVVVYGDRIGKGPITEETPYGKANGHYMAYKQKQERIALQYAHEHKADIRIVRPANVYGAGSKPWVVEVARVLAKGMPALIDGGKGRAGLVLVDNVVEVLLLTAKAELPRGEIFLAVDDNTVTWHEYFHAIADFIKVDAPKSIPRFLAEIGATGGEILWKTLGLSGRPPLTRQALMLVGADNDFKNDKIKNVLGFKPVKTHEQGLSEIAAYLAKNTWQEK